MKQHRPVVIKGDDIMKVSIANHIVECWDHAQKAGDISDNDTIMEYHMEIIHAVAGLIEHVPCTTTESLIQSYLDARSSDVLLSAVQQSRLHALQVLEDITDQSGF
jgi:hypothetical protein